MTMWDVPAHLEFGVIPRRIYCNKLLINPLAQAFESLITTCAIDELKTYDGCFQIRPIRGYEEKYKAAMKAGLMKAIK